MNEGERGEERGRATPLVLVARKGVFGLPTACPNCLTVYAHLRFAKVPFELQLDLTNPNSGIITIFFNKFFLLVNFLRIRVCFSTEGNCKLV